jgi:type I restriction enzyme, S subunit
MTWEKVEIGDVVEKIIGGGTPSKTCPKYWGGNIPWCSVKDMLDDRFQLSQTEDYITEDGLKNSASNLIPAGTIITATRMGLGRAFINKVDMAINQDLKAILPNARIDKRFLLWLIVSKRAEIEGLGTGATVKGIRLETLKGIKLHLPPLPIQKRIAEILSAYDDLIENNLKRIKLLREAATMNFKQYYNNLTKDNSSVRTLGDLVAHEIGGGWGNDEENAEFTDPAFVIRGTDIDDIMCGSTSNVPYRYHKRSNLQSRSLKDGDIVFEVSGGSQNEGVGKTLLIKQNLLGQFNGEVMCASFCKLYRPANKELSVFLYDYLQYLRTARITEIFEIRSASNIVNYNWTAFLKYQRIIVPNDDLIKSYNKLVVPLTEQIYCLAQEIKLLKESRDILLPRLMNGTITVTP